MPAKSKDLSPKRNKPKFTTPTGGQPASPSNAILMRYMEGPERYAAGREAMQNKVARAIREAQVKVAERQIRLDHLLKVAETAIVQNVRDRIPGGLGDDKEPQDFDQAELELGIKHELEHTTDREIAQEIAQDHLVEEPEYYSKMRAREQSKEAQEMVRFAQHMAKEATDWSRKLYNLAQRRGETLEELYRKTDRPIARDVLEDVRKLAGEEREPEVDGHTSAPQDKMRPRSEMILFNGQGIYAIDKGDYLLLPGGGVDDGEQPRDACIRETIEESNRHPINVSNAGVVESVWPEDSGNEFWDESEFDGERTYFFLGVDSGEAGVTHDDLEDFRVMPFKQVQERLTQLIDREDQGWARRNNQERLRLVRDAQRLARTKGNLKPIKQAASNYGEQVRHNDYRTPYTEGARGTWDGRVNTDIDSPSRKKPKTAPGSALPADGLTSAHTVTLRHTQVDPPDGKKIGQAASLQPPQAPQPPQPTQPPQAPQMGPELPAQGMMPTEWQLAQSRPEAEVRNFVEQLAAQQQQPLQQQPQQPLQQQPQQPPQQPAVQNRVGPAPTGRTAPMKAAQAVNPATESEAPLEQDSEPESLESDLDLPAENLDLPGPGASIGTSTNIGQTPGARAFTTNEAQFADQQRSAEMTRAKIAQGLGIEELLEDTRQVASGDTQKAHNDQTGALDPVAQATTQIASAQNAPVYQTTPLTEKGDTRGLPVPGELPKPNKKEADVPSLRPLQQHLMFTPEGNLVARRVGNRRLAFPTEGTGRPAPYESDVLFVPESGVPDEGYHGYRVGLRVGDFDQELPEGFEAVDPTEALKDLYASMGLSVNKPFRQLDRARARAIVRYLKRRKRRMEAAGDSA